uniref:Bromodomain adjacent to zinc finger domain protein 1A n=1 Tax=Rodentolepis nana TaxID=102285 RepID=A0A0R3T3U6_RODNA
LGIELSKIPITPYTAPELLRLLLSCELAKGTFSTNDLAIDRIRQIINSFGGGNTSLLEPSRVSLGANSLFEQLSSVDLFALNVEHRILAIEVLVELMLDFDMVDEYIISCHQRSVKTNKERLTLAKQERTVIPPELMEEKISVQKEPEMNDLASVVKSRRLLAAKAAEEREKRETAERHRRELEAKIEAEEKALAKAEHDETVATTDYQLSCRARLLGTDRFDRRYWRFTCAPDRIFVESNWGPKDYRVLDSHSNEDYPVASLPPPHIVTDESLSSAERAHRFSYAARSNWSVFDKAEELDNLSKSLAERGARESHLKKNLVQSGLLENLKELIAISKAERSSTEIVELVDVDRSPSSRDEIVIEKITAKPRGDAQAILANVFLKVNMYETEIHLRDGGLGGVPEFPGWMAKILSIQSHYGLCFCLTGSVPSTPLKGGPTAIHAPSPATLQCAVSFQSQKVTTTPLQSAAEALITMGLNVHRRFLSVPKVLPREKKSGSENINNCEEAGPEEIGLNQQNVEYRPERSTREGDVELWVESWTKAVRSASTFSRLNVLHACLDACIQWEKSVANVRCRICRKKGDDDSLLLCDGCNAGFHLYCLRPSLHTIPEGDWFCVSCKPPPSRTKPTTSASSIRRRDRYSRDEGSETSSDNEESVGAGDCASESVSSDGDDDGRRRLRSKKSQSTRRIMSRSSSSSHFSQQAKAVAAKTQSTSNDVLCLVCDEEGIEEDELIICSTCPNAFHSNCHNPPLRSASRRAPWVCSVCRVSRGQSTAMAQSLRLRGNSRANRKSSYARLHKVSTTPRKRPRPVSYNEDSSEGESVSSDDTLDQEDDGGEENGASGYDDREESEETEGNDTEATEEQADDEPPPRKRARISASTITSAKSASYTCADLISSVLRHRNSWPFQEPVDAEEVPDYYEIVVDPVDLSMINNWLKNGRYDGNAGPKRLADDLAKMFYNAELYNSVDSDIWKAGSQLENHIRGLFKRFSPPVTYKRDALN